MSFPLRPSASIRSNKRLAKRFERFNGEDLGPDLQRALDDIVYEIYGLDRADRLLIEDLLAGPVERYAQYGNYQGFRLSSEGELSNYADALVFFLNATLSSAELRFRPGGAVLPLATQWFELISPIILKRRSRMKSADIAYQLARLDVAWQAGPPRGVYLRRNAKLLEDGAIHIIKPTEFRYWTPGRAPTTSTRSCRSYFNRPSLLAQPPNAPASGYTYRFLGQLAPPSKPLLLSGWYPSLWKESRVAQSRVSTVLERGGQYYRRILKHMRAVAGEQNSSSNSARKGGVVPSDAGWPRGSDESSPA